MSDEIDTVELKSQFAFQLLVKHGNAMAAAMFVIPNNRNFQLFIAEYWPSDEYVLMERRRFLDKHGEAFFLPTKYDIAHKTALIADTAPTTGDRLSAIKLYAQIVGIIDNGSNAPPVTNNLTIDARKVMVVKDHGDDANWQRKLLANQHALATATLDD